MFEKKHPWEPNTNNAETTASSPTGAPWDGYVPRSDEEAAQLLKEYEAKHG